MLNAERATAWYFGVLPAVLAFGSLTDCVTHREPASPAAAPSSRSAARQKAPPASKCSDWTSGSYLGDGSAGTYRLKLAPGDSVPTPAPAFEDTFSTQTTSTVTVVVGTQTYVLLFTEDNGDAAHLFIFQKLPERFCFAGAWEMSVGGLGATAHVNGTWIAPGGRRALILVRSTALARGYFYEAKPGEACPPTDENPRPAPPTCHIPPGYSAYYHVLVLDTAAHRLWRAFASEQEGFGTHEVLGPEDEYAGAPVLVPSAQGLTLSVEGSDYRWNDDRGTFEATAGARALPE